jgi:hypothetical protein
VQVAVLLGQVGSIRKCNLNDAWFNAAQFSADQTHDRLFGEARFDFFREEGITWLMRH